MIDFWLGPGLDFIRMPFASVREREATALAKRIQTQRGDALILGTEHSYTIYAVGPVAHDGQEDFHAEAEKVTHVTTRDAAVAEAKKLVLPGGRILMRDIDTGAWSEI